MRRKLIALFVLCYFSSLTQEIETKWESMAKNYKVPEWFQGGKIGVWFHWGIPSATNENRLNDKK